VPIHQSEGFDDCSIFVNGCHWTRTNAKFANRFVSFFFELCELHETQHISAQSQVRVRHFNFSAPFD
jgi:hypothetical protein